MNTLARLTLQQNITNIFEPVRAYFKTLNVSSKKPLLLSYRSLLNAYLHLEHGGKIRNLLSKDSGYFIETTGLVKDQELTWSALTKALAAEDKFTEETLGTKADLITLKKHSAIQALLKALEVFPVNFREILQKKAGKAIETFKDFVSTSSKLKKYSDLFKDDTWIDFAKNCKKESQKFTEFLSQGASKKALEKLVTQCIARLEEK